MVTRICPGSVCRHPLRCVLLGPNCGLSEQKDLILSCPACATILPLARASQGKGCLGEEAYRRSKKGKGRAGVVWKGWSLAPGKMGSPLDFPPLRTLTFTSLFPLILHQETGVTRRLLPKLGFRNG